MNITTPQKKLTLKENTIIRSLVCATLWSLIWVAHSALLFLFCHFIVTSLTFECKFFFYKKKVILWWDRHEALPEGGCVQGPDHIQLDWSPLPHFLSFSSCFSHTSLREDPFHYTSSISVRMGHSHTRLYTRDDSGTNYEAHMDNSVKSSESASVPRCGERISGLKRKVFLFGPTLTKKQ